MQQVSIRELKSKLSAYVRQVGRGETLIVTSRNTPVAKMTTYPNTQGLSGEHKRLLAIKEAEWDGQAPELPSHRPVLQGEPATHAVLEGRR